LGHDLDDKLYANGLAQNFIKKKFEDLVKDYRVTLKYLGFQNDTKSPCLVWNKLYEKAYQDGCQYFYQLGDDIIFMTTNWLDHFVEKLRKSPMGENVGVVGPIDINIRTEAKLTQAFVGRKHYEIFGYLYPEVFKNWYSDNWITMVYQSKFNGYCQEVLIRNGSGVGQERYVVDESAKGILGEEVKKGVDKVEKYLNK
jgi:hypothetical protein